MAQPRARHLLRSLAVVFGSALVLRFVLLNGMAAPGGSFTHRLFTAALEGLTLGALGLEYHAPVTGYAAFVALGLFFVGLLLLPHDGGAWELERSGSWGTDNRRNRGELPAPTRHDSSDRGSA